MSAGEIAVVLTHSGAGMLSVCGSGLILTSLLVQSWRNQKKLRPFQRLLLGFSVYDLMHSTAVSFTTLPVRADADVWGAHGTIATCTAQGFFQQQAQGGFWYNTAMSLYFLAVIRYGVKDKQIVPYEKCFHITTFVVLETLAVTGLFLEWYNPIWFPELGCWFSPWPIGCEGDECERGEYTFWLAVFGAVIFQVLAFIIISVSNILIFTALRNQEQLMARYQGGGENQFSREAAVQGFLYSAAALNTVFWGFLSLFLGTFSDLNEGLRLFVAIMNAFMFPIQGFFTFLIYLRPIYKRAQKHNPDCGRVKVVLIALYEDERTARQKQFASRGRTFTTTATVLSTEIRVSAVPPEEEEQEQEQEHEHSPGCTSIGFGSDTEETKSRTHTYVHEEEEKEEGTSCDETRTPVNLDSQVAEV